MLFKINVSMMLKRKKNPKYVIGVNIELVLLSVVSEFVNAE